MKKRVSFKQLQDYMKIIKMDFPKVDIRLYDEGRGVSILRYEEYESKQPSVSRCKSKREALAELMAIHSSLFGV